MKNMLISLVLLPIMFTITLSAPVERHDGVRHRPSFRHGQPSLHRGALHRILEALAKRPPNFTFTPVYSMEDFVHVEYGTSTYLEASDFRFSATLSKLDLDDETINTGRFSEGDTQTVVRSHDIHGARHVMISISDSLMWAMKRKGVSEDTIPKYVRQNVHVADPASGDRYQLVPDNSPEKSVSLYSDVFTINLKLK